MQTKMKYIFAICGLLVVLAAPSYGQGTGPMGGGGGMNQVIQGANSITNLVDPYYWNIPLETSNAVTTGSLTISNNVFSVITQSGTVTNQLGGPATNLWNFTSASQDANGCFPILISKGSTIKGRIGFRDTDVTGMELANAAGTISWQLGSGSQSKWYSGVGQMVHDGNGLQVVGTGAGRNLAVGGGLRVNAVFTGTNYIMSSTDNIVMFNATSVGTTVSATLPPSSTTVTNGIMFVIKDFQRVASATNIICYAPSGTTINGVNSATISSDGGALSISMGGTNYFTY